MKYYVYVHKRKDSGVVFYVGKGCGRRAYARHHFKAKAWKQVNDISGHVVEILHKNLTEDQALAIEKEYLTNIPKHWALVNKQISQPVDYSVDFSALFYYNPESPSGLSWRVKPKTFGKFKIQAGDKVGSQSYTEGGRPKSWDTTIRGMKYKVHRIIWVLVYGSIDKEMVIDHIDRNPFNNQIENLRLVSQQENSLNKINSKSH